MKILSTILRWIKEYGYVLLLFVFAIAGFIFLRRIFGDDSMVSFEQTKDELDAIRESSNVRKIEAKKGHSAAVELVGQKYDAKIQNLEAKQMREANALRNDPVALSKYMVRAGSNRSK